MGFLTSLIPAGVSLISNLFGGGSSGSKKTSKGVSNADTLDKDYTPVNTSVNQGIDRASQLQSISDAKDLAQYKLGLDQQSAQNAYTFRQQEADRDFQRQEQGRVNAYDLQNQTSDRDLTRQTQLDATRYNQNRQQSFDQFNFADTLARNQRQQDFEFGMQRDAQEQAAQTGRLGMQLTSQKEAQQRDIDQQNAVRNSAIALASRRLGSRN